MLVGLVDVEKAFHYNQKPEILKNRTTGINNYFNKAYQKVIAF